MKRKVKFIFSFVILILLCFKNIYAKELNILSKGEETAKVTIKIFSSLTCPYCADFHLNILKNLEKDFLKNKTLKIEHYAFPLDLAALNAEKIVRCGDNMNTKFKLLDTIYEKQRQWAVGTDINKINDSLIKLGKSLNLKENKLKSCLADERLQDEILNERINAQKKYNIESTPTIYINEKKYKGKFDLTSIKKYIEKNALSYSVAFVNSSHIDKNNILNSTFKAMHKSIEGLDIEPDFILVDGNLFKPYMNLEHKCIIKGDQKYQNIAAASILAKTYRDEYMSNLHLKFPEYDWIRNKGYGTKYHIDMIKKFGRTKYHRKSFQIKSNQQTLQFN